MLIFCVIALIVLLFCTGFLLRLAVWVDETTSAIRSQQTDQNACFCSFRVDLVETLDRHFKALQRNVEQNRQVQRDLDRCHEIALGRDLNNPIPPAGSTMSAVADLVSHLSKERHENRGLRNHSQELEAAIETLRGPGEPGPALEVLRRHLPTIKKVRKS